MTMKRTLLCAALLAATPLAFATPNVTVYGMVDAYVQVYNGGNGTVFDMGSGGKGGSRFGIKGSEDLGGGTEVFFRLENGFMLDNGTNSPASGTNSGWAFQREAVLGVKNKSYGSFSMGRQYTLNFGNAAMFDAFGLSLGSTLNNFMSPAPYITGSHISGINGLAGSDNLTRRDNSFLYESPSFSGLKGSVMVSLGEQTKLNGNASNKLGNMYAAQLTYRTGSFATGLAYTYQSLVSAAGAYDFKASNSHENLYSLGASYDFGVTKLYGNLIYRQGGKATDENPNLIVYSTSLKTPLCGGYLLNGFAYLKNNTTDKADAWNVSARFDYPLSKRTTVYAGAAYMHNQANVNYTINGGGGSSAAPATNLGKSPWTAFTGINHAF